MYMYVCCSVHSPSTACASTTSTYLPTYRFIKICTYILTPPSASPPTHISIPPSCHHFTSIINPNPPATRISPFLPPLSDKYVHRGKGKGKKRAQRPASWPGPGPDSPPGTPGVRDERGESLDLALQTLGFLGLGGSFCQRER